MELGRLVLGENERLAERVRGILLAKGIAAINVVSSPGSGKTTLLERTLERIADTGLKTAVLVGDLATDNDARRLSATGTQAIQITTGNVCHLDAHMILHGLEKLDLAEVDVLFLENVGNLVCPAAFDLGEDHRVVLSSVTEGEDKPLKYPTIFDGADLALVTKMDLAEVLETDLDALHSAIRDVAPAARIVDVSARSGDGLDAWVQFIVEAAERKRAVAL
ncbi:MAG: hydrogenase nickel incorporation protein HypB [Planctomycetota bacterium]